MRGPEQLERRMRSRGFCLVEPDGQDGRLCQYLAIIHQLKLNDTPAVQATRNAYAMESHMLRWLETHGPDITGVHAIRGDEAELSLLRDSWTDIDLHKLRHNSLSTVLSMLAEHGILAQAYVYDSRGEEYDGIISAHEIYGVQPTITLQLAFVRSRRCRRGT